MKGNNSLFLVGIIFMFTFLACTKNTEELIDDPLNVQFFNDSNSDFTIKVIEVRSRGLIGEENQEMGDWGNNLLTGDLILDPGSSTSFVLNIPTYEWSEYRIGVIDGNGNTEMVLPNPLIGVQGTLPISHLESNDRKVSIEVKYDESKDAIYIASWSDFAI